MKILKCKKGITLIPLIITIIVLIILATISINMLTQNGLLNKSKKTNELTNKSEATEKMNLKLTSIQIISYDETKDFPNLQYVANKLCDDDEIEYVELTSQIAALNHITIGENNSSIFTKLKEYPYEFEINGYLQLASIDGKKVDTPTNCDHISNLINDFSPELKETNGTYISISIPENITENSSRICLFIKWKCNKYWYKYTIFFYKSRF